MTAGNSNQKRASRNRIASSGDGWTADYQPMGFRLHVHADHRAVIAQAESAFGRFGTDGPRRPIDFRFRFRTTPALGVQGLMPSYQDSGREVHCRAGNVAALVVDRSTGTAEGTFSADILDQPSYLRCHFLETALLVLIQSRGLMGVHGAAIVRDGTAILLRGGSGTGKSTLAYAAARSGRFKVLAEDVVWIDSRNGLWRGLPWWHHLLPDAVKLFPELTAAGPPAQIRGKRKLAVDLDRFHPGAATPVARSGPVVFLERSGGTGSRLRPFSKVEARELWAVGQAGTESDFPDYPRRVDEILGGETFRLELGSDLDEALDLLEITALGRHS